MPPSPEFIELLEKLPLPSSIEKLLADAVDWDYQTVGDLKYINSKGEVAIIPTLISVRVAEIFEKLFTLNFSAIGDAHHASCGFRYMQGTCQGTVCPTN